jgi:hypothetical protein
MLLIFSKAESLINLNKVQRTKHQSCGLKGQLKTAYFPIYKNHFEGDELANLLRNRF